ncbi:MAG TPA: lasso peptide biosynthesis B2 protein [Gaiellaceae bacterium]|nr:lasso peptide biosynthesis B2 protein [Gaiellaceae bacterium]
MSRLSKLRRLDLATLRAAWWAVVQLESVRRQLRVGGYREVRVGPPPRVPDHATRGVHAVLRLARSTCLQRALVLQSWLRARGVPRDVVIGVTGSADFRAHAWVDGEPAPPAFRELTRLPAG